MSVRRACARERCGHERESHHKHTVAIDLDDGGTDIIAFYGRCSVSFCACFDYVEPAPDKD